MVDTEKARGDCDGIVEGRRSEAPRSPVWVWHVKCIRITFRTGGDMARTEARRMAKRRLRVSGSPVTTGRTSRGLRHQPGNTRLRGPEEERGAGDDIPVRWNLLEDQEIQAEALKMSFGAGPNPSITRGQGNRV